MKKLLLIMATCVLACSISAQNNVGIGTNNPGSTLQVIGSLAAGYNSQTGTTYTMAGTDYFVQLDPTATGNATFTLPAPSATMKGRVYVIKNATSAYTLTVVTSSAEMIDGSLNINVAAGKAITVINNGKTGTGTVWNQVTAASTGGGVTGATGSTGANGTNGTNGSTGAAGTNGTNGAVGATGVAGANGITGATGQTGATGTTGVTGSTGPGYLATSATSMTIGTGSQTFATQSNLAYLAADQIRIANSASNYMEGTVSFYAAPTMIVNVTRVVGSGTFSTWNLGITGVAGAAGSNGTNGTNGTNGAAGATGATGATGYTGAAGATGTTGATGYTGTAGNNGTNGTNGAAGATGATGATGYTGAAGNNGTNGTNGAAGATGATGATGYTGTAGNNGTNGTNGVAGTTGATGYTGAAGNNGTNGTNGAAGATGATGATGYTGTAGNNGTNGTNGAAGATGATGATGYTGSNGATGATGSTGLLSAGTTGSTPYYNGSSWIVNSTNIYNDGGSVGINNAAPGSNLDVTGSQSRSINVQTGNYTLTATDYFVLYESTTATGTFTLPAALAVGSGNYKGRTYVIKDSSSYALTITASTSPVVEKIDNAASIVLQPGNIITLVSNGRTAAGSTWNVAGVSSANGAATGWSTLGNAGTTASGAAIGSTVTNNFIGTTDATDFVLATDNLERMRIASGGNVGIGIASPLSKLMVYNGITNALTSAQVGAATAVFDGGSGTANSVAIIGSNWSGSGTRPESQLQFWNNAYGGGEGNGATIGTAGSAQGTAAGQVSANLVFSTSSNTTTPTERMRITSAGNVGIGTNNPGNNLNIVNSSTSQALNVDLSGTDALLQLDPTATTNWARIGSNGSDLAFLTEGSDKSGVTNALVAMMILNTGKVGIGAIAPLSTLDVNGSFLARGANTNTPSTPISAVEFMTGRSNASGLVSGQTSADIALQYGGGGYRHYIVSRHNAVASSNQNAIDFYLNNGTTSGASSAPGTGNLEMMSITANGVGIGSSSPTAQLHVYQSANNGKQVLIDGPGSSVAAGTSNPALGWANNGTLEWSAILAGGAGQWSSDAAINDMVFRPTATSQHILFNENGGGASTMAITNAGVGIGTTSPAGNLHIAATTVGVVTGANGALVVANNPASGSGAKGIWLQNCTTGSIDICGETFNGHTGAAPATIRFLDNNYATDITFRVKTGSGSSSANNGDVEAMRITGYNATSGGNQGCVGIGTTSPSCALEVAGQCTNNIASPRGSYYITGDGFSQSTYNAPDVVAKFDGRVWSTVSFDVSSDRRIKNIIGVTNNKNDLATLEKIQIVDYTMKDKIADGNKQYKKVIAQDLAAVYSNAVSYMTDFVPDIFSVYPVSYVGDMATICMNRSYGIKAGDKLRLMNQFNTKVDVIVTDTTNGEISFAAPKNISRDSTKVFVYGRQVNDKASVDYDAISMLNVSATQELSKQLTAEQAKNKELQRAVDNLKAENAELRSSKADVLDVNKLKAQLDDLKTLIEKNGIRTEK